MKYVLICIGILLSAAANARDLKTKDDVITFSNEVMALAGKGKTSEALGLLKPYIQIPISEFDVSIEQVNLQAPMIKQRFGDVVGSELIEVEESGKSLILVVFIQKYEKHIMRWRLYFYKPLDKWIVNTYRTDDQVQSLFKN